MDCAGSFGQLRTRGPHGTSVPTTCLGSAAGLSMFLPFSTHTSIVGSSLLIVVARPPELESCDIKSDLAVFSGVELHPWERQEAHAGEYSVQAGIKIGLTQLKGGLSLIGDCHFSVQLQESFNT